ncbi:MFS transporter [Nocardioides panacisoli]|uniref:MFS transporter n=1 Tax=Nocardioides panacisoli TaxID=627624 RepID=UPI001C62E2EC|nr:MFS transporter [Nocardioides panacisoli]QYJ02722.1 MFS transporter [Nocardioides panacisoli]
MSGLTSTALDRWRFATLATITTVAAVVSSLGAPLVPSIAAAYDVSLSAAQWVLTATLVGGAVVTPVLGRWGSGRLRRPVVLGALATVLAGTVMAALPLGLGALIAGRALQGVGLGLVPLVLAVARDLWEGRLLASRLGLLSVTTVAGAGLGYPVTGLVAELVGVTGAYWFGTSLLGATLLLAARFLPGSTEGEPQPVDLVGVVLLSGGSVSVLLAISQGGAWGWSSARVLGLGVAGTLLVGAWIAWTRRRLAHGRRPLVDLALAARPGVVGPNTVAFGIGVGMYALLTFAVLVVRADGTAGFGLDRGVAAAGLVLVPYALVSVGGSRVALWVSHRHGPRLLLPIGAAVFASSLLSLGLAHDTLWQVLLAMALGGLGSGFSFSSMAMLIVPHVPHEETGSAMAFNQLLRYLGFSVGSALSVALVAAYGGDGAAFRGAALTLAGVCLAVGALALGRRTR